MLKIKFAFFLFLLATYFIRPQADLLAQFMNRFAFLENGIGTASILPVAFGVIALAGIGVALALYEQRILQFFKHPHLQIR